MRIIGRELRQLIREELLREAWDNTPLVSYVTLRAVAEDFVFEALQGQHAAESGRAPKGNSLYYIPEPELSITVFKPAFEVPKGVTMAILERGA